MATPALVRLESLSFDEVCGEDTSGRTQCIRGNQEKSWIPDAVGTLQFGFSNDLASCGIDEEGVKCWRLTSGSDKFDGLNKADAVRSFFKETKPESVQAASSSFCGLDGKTSDLRCLLPSWTRTHERTLRIQPRQPITAIGIKDDVVCWAESDSSHGTLHCREDRTSGVRPTGMKMKNVIEIEVGGDWMCARSKSEAHCWNDTASVSLPEEILTAMNWSSNQDGLCALTRDHRVVCVDPLTGLILPSGFGHSIPAHYTTPNPNHEQLWITDSTACVRETQGQVSCWSWWNPIAAPIPFSRPVQKIFGESYSPCALLDNGQAECRLHAIESQTLSNVDRIRVEFGGYNKCYWNSSGIDCRGRLDNIRYRSVRALATSRYDEALCVIGVPSDDPIGIESVQCFSYDPALKNPPFALQNPTAVATNENRACAISDEGVTCWGAPYLDTPQPNTVSQPKKVEMSTRHACAIDQFGFVCWGELATLNLQIPSGLDQPGRVVDFALGASRTCVVLDTGTVECWGRDYELTGPPPITSGATSILGRAGLFCALDRTGVHCWGGNTSLPQ